MAKQFVDEFEVDVLELENFRLRVDAPILFFHEERLFHQFDGQSALDFDGQLIAYPLHVYLEDSPQEYQEGISHDDAVGFFHGVGIFLEIFEKSHKLFEDLGDQEAQADIDDCQEGSFDNFYAESEEQIIEQSIRILVVFLFFFLFFHKKLFYRHEHAEARPRVQL